MRFSAKYRPRKLSEIIGQPPVRILQKLAANPYACAIMLEGSPGIGKTAAAYAFAHEIGCFDEDTWPEVDPPGYHMGWNTGLYAVNGNLSLAEAEELFRSWAQTRKGSSSGFVTIILDELEKVSVECVKFLRAVLDPYKMPKHCIVIATSNKPDLLGEALLERFRRYRFRGDMELLQAAQPLLARIWSQESKGAPMPSGLPSWGYGNGRYSIRAALSELQDHVELSCV
jgi:replication-associated recombination protein RarA